MSSKGYYFCLPKKITKQRLIFREYRRKVRARQSKSSPEPHLLESRDLLKPSACKPSILLRWQLPLWAFPGFFSSGCLMFRMFYKCFEFTQNGTGSFFSQSFPPPIFLKKLPLTPDLLPPLTLRPTPVLSMFCFLNIFLEIFICVA